MVVVVERVRSLIVLALQPHKKPDEFRQFDLEVGDEGVALKYHEH
jgi:hypothetical protein